MDFSTALPTFVVTLREGFEAALVVGIVLACLKKAQQTQFNRSVYKGIGAGVVASVLVGFLLGGILQGVNTYQSPYTPLIKEILAAIFGLVAVIMLSWMLLWMTQQAKSLKSEVETTVNTTLSKSQQAGQGIFLLIFIAVLREGFETVLFIIAKFEQGWQIPTVGAIAGLSLATILGILLFAGGVKINVRLFFQIMGILLLLIVGGLVMGVLKHLDASIEMLAQLNPHYQGLCFTKGGSCLLGPQIWDGSTLLNDSQFPGIVLKSLFGYRQTLFLGQGIAYILFLLGMGGAYFKSLRGQSISGNKTTPSVT